MQYFDIPTIKASIEALEGVSANWLIPAFVFAANDVGTDALVDMSKNLGTDQFLDRYFNAALIGVEPFKTGNNLLRPRLKGIRWDRGDFAGDYMIRQDTKMWGNLFSSRGYREMRMQGYLEGEKTTTRLTDAFQGAFEAEIPASFQFEDFMVWLFAFKGFPDEIDSWQGLYDHLVTGELELLDFQDPYKGRFRLRPERPWPETLGERPSNEEFLQELAPRLAAHLAAPAPEDDEPSSDPAALELMSADDAVLAIILNAIQKKTSHSFLLAGPPGTGKTKYAHDIANFLTKADKDRILFLQFHPAFGYDDFVEGFRPVEAKDAGGEARGVTYKLDARHFLNFASSAKADPDKHYVLVIDELNRGDVARIFGELLTYLELDYRDKEFTLAISGTKTRLPRNLIVLATANPFDRSVTDLDDALLRRFIVITLEPDKAFLSNYLKGKNVEARVLSRTLRLFDILNEAFPAGFGHTNFLGVRSIEDLADVWEGRVKLGLQRTLFHDRQKYDGIREDVDQLLKLDEDAEAAGDDDADNEA
ncbi:McrB family protein [Celeribacter indicus]|uniref:Restriction enzyme n=1 Tax=Celeribacter indicus TaxID=1208324 RepID=A0A0B5DWZ0_9RHOB|nr:AAA family ATPase [Celeribacter indicus]AJE47973.1 restriction enzyme [Celeribacter indicus]SDW28417.1 5-methylcytosine-specific restriction enzyme B [Celeribacter indicus]